MHSDATPKFDYASEHIMQLQGMMKWLPNLHKGVEMGLLQQYLDEESLYIKQIPRVGVPVQLVGLRQRVQSLCRSSVLLPDRPQGSSARVYESLARLQGGMV